MEMVSECYRHNLAQLVADGTIDEELIDDAVRRILVKKYELDCLKTPSDIATWNGRKRLPTRNLCAMPRAIWPSGLSFC